MRFAAAVDIEAVISIMKTVATNLRRDTLLNKAFRKGHICEEHRLKGSHQPV